MVHPALHRVQFGVGDVGVILSVAGTREEPQALMIFENQRPEPIRGLTDDADLSKVTMGTYVPSETISMQFSNAESIDSLISALRGLKKTAFESDGFVWKCLGKRNGNRYNKERAK